MKIRELASLALVSILSKSGLTYEDYLRKWLFEDRMISHNEGHGRILQVRIALQVVEFSNGGIQNKEKCCLRINIPKENF